MWNAYSEAVSTLSTVNPQMYSAEPWSPSIHCCQGKSIIGRYKDISDLIFWSCCMNSCEKICERTILSLKWHIFIAMCL